MFVLPKYKSTFLVRATMAYRSGDPEGPIMYGWMGGSQMGGTLIFTYNIRSLVVSLCFGGQNFEFQHLGGSEK